MAGGFRNPRWKRPYPSSSYQPMTEVLRDSACDGFNTYIVTGGARISSVSIRSVCTAFPREVVGTMGGTKFGYDKDGRPFLTKEPSYF